MPQAAEEVEEVVDMEAAVELEEAEALVLIEMAFLGMEAPEVVAVDTERTVLLDLVLVVAVVDMGILLPVLEGEDMALPVMDPAEVEVRMGKAEYV